MEKEDIRLCIRNDRKAQKKFYSAYKTSMYVLCLRYFSIQEDAKDALQDGFIKVFRDLYQFDPAKGKLNTWLNRVFINTCLEKLRKKRINFQSINEHVEQVKGFESTIISDLNLKDLTRIIQLLPTGYRTVFNLYVIDGYSHKEIAEKLTISVSTSKTQLMKAKRMLKTKLAEELNEL